MKNSLAQCSGYPSLREELRAIENRMVGIRKLLRQQEGMGRGKMDDAVQLAKTIERLAHFGQSCKAEDAFVIASHIEDLSSLLRSEIDAVFAS